MYYKITKIMGILNVTPDSFSDGGAFAEPDEAVAHAIEMQAEGADFIDVGAESTRPGFTPLTEEEEWSRLKGILPLLSKSISVPISVDTYKAKTAELALNNGAKVINDIWGGLADPEMFRVLAGSGAAYILMHNSTETPLLGKDVVQEVRQQLQNRVESALHAGMSERQIILDPGVGFGKTQAQNLELINRIDEMRIDPFPILLGPSRKSVIGHVLGLPVSERLEGTAAIVAVAIMRGTDILRVHDVRSMVRVAKMTDALISSSVVL